MTFLGFIECGAFILSQLGLVFLPIAQWGKVSKKSVHQWLASEYL